MGIWNWSQAWEVAGPFFIMGFVALALGFISLIILKVLPNGLIRDIVRALAIFVIIGGALLSLQIASQFWAN